jgi:hypothetical protein
MVRWLSAVPPSQGPARVEVQLSLTGPSGPWRTLASDLPDNGCFQWKVDSGGSDHCRIKVVVTTATGSAQAVSAADFTIDSFTVDAHGPYAGTIGSPVSFTGSAENGTAPYAFHWDFGDGATADEQNPTHAYGATGNYSVVLTVTDGDGTTASDGTYALIADSNTPPLTPTLTGPVRGAIGKPVVYTVSTTDPEDGSLWYYCEWGDGTSSGWVGPFPSGVDQDLNHTWTEKGTYTIRCKAKDSSGAESAWAELPVRMPFSIVPLAWWHWLAVRFPQLYTVLCELLS